MLTRLLLLSASLVCLMGADWPQFRGADTTGVSAETGIPTTFNLKEGKNIAWQADLPGRGLSGAIVVDDKVILTASSGYRQDRLHVLCFSAADGAKLWERQFWATGRTMSHPKMCNATPTPASDGERIFAFYSSNDLICLDLDGRLLWFRGLTHDFPNASNSLGMSSSPVVVGKTLVVQVECDSDSFTTGLDVATGEHRWKHARPKLSNWTSPAVLPNPDGPADKVLIQSGNGLTAYDAETGKEAWAFAAGCGVIPSTAILGNQLFVPSKGLTALKLGSSAATPEVQWSEEKLGPSTASAVAHQGRVYSVNKVGVLTCADAETGKTAWQLRIKGPFSGTPVLADGHLYFFNEEGLGQVVKLGADEGELVENADFGETILCSPAIANGGLYVRSDKHLWKIGSK